MIDFTKSDIMDFQKYGKEVKMKPNVKASIKYDKENTIQVRIKLNKKTDADIIEALEAVPNKNGYLKDLIRKDIKKL